MAALGNKRPTVSRARMERAAKALHQAGVSFGGFRLHLDGSVDVLAGDLLTTAHKKASESGDDPIVQALAEFRKEHGYG